jgi:hypothetical protein
MRTRCFNQNHPVYERYGGAGIAVCDRWNPAKGGSFENFLADMGERPEGKTLDRYPKNDGNYDPGNCRWATPSEQQQNRIATKLTPEKVIGIRQRVAAGKRQAAVAREYDVSRQTISNVINRTWRNITDVGFAEAA